MLTEDEFRAHCNDKGYVDIRIKDYEPDMYDPMHTHDRSIIAMVLDGRITLEWEEGATTYAPGDVCELEAGTLHAEKTGAEGARLILGFK